VQKYGKLFRKEDYKAHKGDPNMFPPGAQFAAFPTVIKGT